MQQKCRAREWDGEHDQKLDEAESDKRSGSVDDQRT